MTMLAYHSDPAVKRKILTQLRAHAKADQTSTNAAYDAANAAAYTAARANAANAADASNAAEAARSIHWKACAAKLIELLRAAE